MTISNVEEFAYEVWTRSARGQAQDLPLHFFRREFWHYQFDEGLTSQDAMVEIGKLSV